MTILSEPNRRHFLGTALAFGASVQFSKTGAAANHSDNIDFTNPEDGLRANVKLRGSLGNEWVWRHYWGDVLAVLPDGAPIPMFKFQGLIKAKWTDNGDGTHTELLYDTSAFLDKDSEEILTIFENPITGQLNETIQVWDGPSSTTLTRNGPVYPWTQVPPTEPVILPWQVVDGHVWLTEQAVFERPHPLQPNEWPLASSGEKTVSSINLTLSGRLEELQNPDLVSAPHDMNWVSMRSWLPWLLMGQRPGLLMTRGIGRKISGPDALPSKMLEIIERQQPNYLTSEAPWEKPMNSWQRYAATREPISQ
ncbi:MAG: DUF1838 family protein [Rhodospirillaceae bacterium]